MKLSLGMKSDPIEYRYSYDWLFDLLNRCNIRNVQLGSFFELYALDDEYFIELRENAEKKNIRIKSCFTSHRELGGFLSNNTYLEKVTRRNYKKLIHVASILGVDYVGSNAGATYRDRMEYKKQGIEGYLAHMKELMHYASEKGLKGLTLEPMSCRAEPPTSPDEIDYMLTTLHEYHQRHASTVPVYTCGDIAHGYADEHGNVKYDNYTLFQHQIPYMVEFHLKNTDAIFRSTFGFTEEEKKKGIVDLKQVKTIIDTHEKMWPIEEVTGYLEIGGPKLGRDYSDYQLESLLVESFKSLTEVFGVQ